MRTLLLYFLFFLNAASSVAQEGTSILSRLTATEELLNSLRAEVRELREALETRGPCGAELHEFSAVVPQRRSLLSTGGTCGCESETRIDQSSIQTCSLNVTCDIRIKGKRLADYILDATTQPVSVM